MSSVTITALPTNGKIFIDNTELTSTNLASLGADISKADIDAGKVKFRPESGENGDDYATFTYTVSDGTADSAVATMTVNVNPVDDLPTVQTGVDTATTDDDTTGVGTVTTDEDTDKVFVHTDFNFFDPDNPSSDLTSVTIAALPSDGKIFIDNVELTSSNLNTLGKDISKADIDSGKVIFRPDANENGSNYAAFSYTVSDGAANSAAATMTVNVTSVNDAPVTTAIDIVKTEDDSSFVTNLLAGQTDADGDTLTLSGSPIISAMDSNGQPLTLPENAVSISGANVTVDPTVFGSLDDGESVTIMVDYGVTDGTASADNSAKITINGVNDAPTISPLTDLKSKDNDPYTFDLLKDASDIDGDTLFVSGTPTFTFTDANGAVTNLPNGAVTMTAVSNSVTDNLLTITPGTFAGLASADSVVIGIAYNVSDGTATTANTAAITIKGSNVPPEVIDTKGTSDKVDDEPHIAEITIDEDTPRVFAESDFNFFDIDGDPLSSVTIESLPTDGQVLFNGDELTADNLATLGANISKADIESGELVFRPDPDENGVDYASFSYTVSDGAASSAAATMTVNVTPVNDPPKVATGAETTGTADDTSDIAGVATLEDTDHNFAADDFNFTDVDDDALSSVTITGIPIDGKIFVDGVELTESNLSTLGSNISKSDLDAGKLIFRPDPNENGSGYATFPYTVSDGSASSAVATMTVDVTPVNDAPVVVTGVETASTSDDTSGVGEVSTNEDTDKIFVEDDFNFYDLDGDPLSSVTITSLPSDGKIFVDGVELTLSNIGTLGSAITKADIEGGKLLFRPDVGESGPGYADFDYTVSDGTTSSAVAKMTVNVNAAPSATDGLLDTDEDIEKDGVLSASDPDNSNLVFAISKLPEHGTVTLIDGGPGYRYTPEKHYYGPDSFQFTASDGSIISDAATVTIDVRPVNDTPIERIKLGTQGVMIEGKVKPINVSTFFGDVDALDPTNRKFAEKVVQLENTVDKIAGGALLSPLDPSGTLEYRVSGLPAGMEFEDGKISGRPIEPGIFTIVMTATDGLGLSAVSSFDLMVAKPVIDRSPELKTQADKGRDFEKPDETTPDLNDHDLPKVLKVKPRRDGDIPMREIAPSTVAIGEDMTSGLAADAGLSADSWMNTTTSTSQDVSGNIRVIDLEVKGKEIEVKIADEAVDRAATFKGELANGSRLPNWIKVDPNTGITTAEPPSGAAPVEMRVIAEDSSGNERAIGIVLNPDALIDNSNQDRGSDRESRQAEKQAERIERQVQREVRQVERAERQVERAERQVQREINQVQRQERQAEREAQQSQRLNAQEISETNQETAKTERREARQAQRLESQESAENSQDNAKTELREVRQAERQARSEAREERRAERAENRNIREVTRLSTEVSVLADGRVKFAEGLTAAGEGSMKLMRMLSAPETVTIEITDDARDETTRYEVRQQDGTTAPDWVQVNVETGELIINAPQDSGTLQLTLLAIDGDQQRSIELEVNLDEMREGDDAQTDDVPEGSEEIEGEEPATSSELEPGQYVPLDMQIEAALADNDYGQDLQRAVQARA
ncbi:tandem-95 repeat protein [Alphaproteobacteria bacterium]|nr:tandem-95 repeat protein [Alphaproteobacteria bacterium]